MGYITRDIAQIGEPATLSLARSSNFVTFASKANSKTYIDVDIKVNAVPTTPDLENRTVLRVLEPNGTVHEFKGTTDASKVGGSVFFISTDVTDTAENLRQALTGINWIDANFNVRVPSVWTGSSVANGSTLSIVGRGAGAEFRLNVVAPNNLSNSAYLITWNSNTSNDGDTIKGNAATVEIELDVYEGADVFLGADDRPTDESKLGIKTITLQKTYSGAPVWFDVNGPFTQYGIFNLPSSGWFNTGTLRVFRFVAKVKGINSFTFYQSNALFVLNGFARFAEPVDMSAYIFGKAGPAKLLSNAPTVPIVEGQSAYLNFIYADPQRGVAGVTYPTINIAYKAFSTSGKYLGRFLGAATTGASLHVVNTYKLDFSNILTLFPFAGQIRVALVMAGKDMTEEQAFDVVSSCLHDKAAVSFINKLGGWDMFNFDAEPVQEVQREVDTYDKTPTPTLIGGPEQVYSATVDDTYTLTSSPVSTEVAEWLKELAASHTVLDQDGRVIIITGYSSTISPSDNGMHVVTINYRFNDNYSND